MVQVEENNSFLDKSSEQKQYGGKYQKDVWTVTPCVAAHLHRMGN